MYISHQLAIAGVMPVSQSLDIDYHIFIAQWNLLKEKKRGPDLMDRYR